MGRGRQIAKIISSYPFTWAAVVEIVVFGAAFILWFRPPLLTQLMVLAMGAVLLLLWPIVFLRSDAFRTIYHHLPYKQELDEFERLLRASSGSFQKPARECLALLEKTRQEFKSNVFDSDLDRIFQNLLDLTRNHVQFYARMQQFGTSDQQQTMHNILYQQERSVENSLTALKAFSGNLTLLDIRPDEYEKMGSDLKAINQELQNVIQEV